MNAIKIIFSERIFFYIKILHFFSENIYIVSYIFICILNLYSIDPIYSTIAGTIYIIICIRSNYLKTIKCVIIMREKITEEE